MPKLRASGLAGFSIEKDSGLWVDRFIALADEKLRPVRREREVTNISGNRKFRKHWSAPQLFEDCNGAACANGQSWFARVKRSDGIVLQRIRQRPLRARSCIKDSRARWIANWRRAHRKVFAI